MALTPDRGPLRTIRTATMAVVAVSISVGLHAVARGVVPSTEVVLGGLVVTALVGATTSARRYTPLRAFVVLLALQPVLHLLLVGSCHPVAGVETGTASPSFSQGGWGMVSAHVVAAAVAAWWVSQGDAVLWRWIGEIWLTVTQDPTGDVGPVAASIRPTPIVDVAAIVRQLATAQLHRGPPAPA